MQKIVQCDMNFAGKTFSFVPFLLPKIEQGSPNSCISLTYQGSSPPQLRNGNCVKRKINHDVDIAQEATSLELLFTAKTEPCFIDLTEEDDSSQLDSEDKKVGEQTYRKATDPRQKNENAQNLYWFDQGWCWFDEG
jgi:hypothetical protein